MVLKDLKSDTGFEFKDMPVKVSSTEKLYLDGGSNTYIEEDSADTMIFATGGTTALTLNSSQNATFAGYIYIQMLYLQMVLVLYNSGLKIVKV